MAKPTKRMRAIAERADRHKAYPIDEAVTLLSELSNTKFKESIDVSVNLGVDVRRSDQTLRGATTLPHGTGKTARVAVFAQGDQAASAEAAGADVVGLDDLAERLQQAGAPASPVMGARTLMRDEHVLARQSVGGLEHPQIGLSPAPQTAFRLSETPTPPKNAAPLFAVDTLPVLREILGYSEERIAELLESGAASDRLQER